jgi:hypothetical protein
MDHASVKLTSCFHLTGNNDRGASPRASIPQLFFRPWDENESEVEEESIMEPKNNDISGLSQTSVSVMDSAEGRWTVHRRPVGLTITVEKIDRVLADVQTQIETLRQNRINLGLVRGQLAGMEAKWRGE